MYRCLCGAVFEKPLKRRETACHGYEIRETLFYRLCPQCGLGEPYFERIEEDGYSLIGVCPVCGMDIGLGDAYEWHGSELVHRDCEKLATF